MEFGLVGRHQRQHAPRRKPHLVCVPYAGGSADSFNALKVRLGNEVQFHAVCYPGRGRRSAEPAPRQIGSMAAEVSEVLDHLEGKVVLFGYSMGAIVAFEAAALREKQGKSQVSHVIASACRAPCDFNGSLLSLINDDSLFLERILSYGCLPEELADKPRLLERCLPLLRSDLSACDSYCPISISPISSPITVIGSDNDEWALIDELKRWSRYSSAGTRTFIMRGSHFFLRNNLDAVIGIIRDCLRLADEPIGYARGSAASVSLHQDARGLEFGQVVEAENEGTLSPKESGAHEVDKHPEFR